MTAASDRAAITFVIMASTPWRGHRLYEQRIATAIGARHRVLYVEPPAYPFRAGAPGEPLPSGVLLVRPWTIPFGRRRAFAWFTGMVAGAWVLLRLGAHDRRTAVVVASSMHPATRRVLSRRPIIALVKDDYVAGASLLGASADRLAARRADALHGADRVVVVSPVLCDTVQRVAGRTPVIVPAGCVPHPADRRLPEPVELRRSGRPRAVFIGLLSDRIDFDFLDAAAAAGFDLVVVGGVQGSFGGQDRLDALRAGGRLVLVPATTSERVRAFLEHCDVGLVPYTLSDFNQASFPLKTLEYLAAGLPVIASDLASLRWLAAPHVEVCAPSDFTMAWQRIARSERATVRDECRAFAAANSWDERARRFEELGRALLAVPQASVG